MQIHYHLALNIRPTQPDDQVAGTGTWSIYQDEWTTCDSDDGPVIEASSTPYLDGFSSAREAREALPD